MRSGRPVHALVRRPSPDLAGGVVAHVGELCDLERVLNALGDGAVVLHLAGVVGYSRASLAAMEAVNVRGTETVVDACVECGAALVLCSSVVAVGSCAARSDAPLDEDAPWDRAMERVGYVRTKKAAEDAVVNAARSRGLPAVVLCPSNVYGPGDGAKGSRRTQVKAANGRWPLYTDGGVNIVHIDVVVAAFLSVLRQPGAEFWNGQRWLIVGENVTIRAMLTLFSTHGGNARHAPWLRLPAWLLHAACVLGDAAGSASFTRDRHAVATRFHWYDGRRARAALQLPEIAAADAVRDSVAWMRARGMVRKR